jgi:hypothetical protein
VSDRRGRAFRPNRVASPQAMTESVPAIEPLAEIRVWLGAQPAIAF